MAMTIKCNNVPRGTLAWDQLTAREKWEFSYLDTLDKQCAASFVRYRGEVYDLAEFMYVAHSAAEPLRSFDGYFADSAFSAILMRYMPDPCYEKVIMARMWT